MKIMIVEDNYEYAKHIAVVLHEAGHETALCRTREEFACSGKFSADIVLLDHDLYGWGCDGRAIAVALELPKERLVSISTGSFDLSYCAFHWGRKEWIGSTRIPETQRKLFAARLLEVITEAASK